MLAGLGEVVCDQLRLGGHGLWGGVNDGAGNASMKLFSLPAQQALISGILNQSMLEGIC